MVPRLLAFGGASLGIAVLFVFAQFVSSDARRTDIDRTFAGSTLESTLNRPNASERFPDWTVVEANSAHHALVVDVEARRVEDARKIAEEIVRPMRSRGYQEVLIYIYPVNNRNGPMRRVQWTPRTGFVESAYAPVP